MARRRGICPGWSSRARSTFADTNSSLAISGTVRFRAQRPRPRRARRGRRQMPGTAIGVEVGIGRAGQCRVRSASPVSRRAGVDGRADQLVVKPNLRGDGQQRVEPRHRWIPGCTPRSPAARHNSAGSPDGSAAASNASICAAGVTPAARRIKRPRRVAPIGHGSCTTRRPARCSAVSSPANSISASGLPAARPISWARTRASSLSASGTQFDPDVVSALRHHLRTCPAGVCSRT